MLQASPPGSHLEQRQPSSELSAPASQRGSIEGSDERRPSDDCTAVYLSMLRAAGSPLDGLAAEDVEATTDLRSERKRPREPSLDSVSSDLLAALYDITEASAAETASEASVHPASSVPALAVATEPHHLGRFRYAKEKRRTPLAGCCEGSPPAVQVTAGWTGRVPDGTLVGCTVVSRHDNPATGEPYPHWHRLQDDESSGCTATATIVGGRATFPSLVVIRGDRSKVTESNAIYSSDDQHIIRLMFTVHFTDALTGVARVASTVSGCIHSTELKIHEVSHSKLSARQPTKAIVLTSKVKKPSTLLRITDPTPGGWVCDHVPLLTQSAQLNEPTEGWILDEHNRPTCVVAPTYVHYQSSLVVLLPAYWAPDISVPHRVELQVVDTSQRVASAPFVVEYVP